ncbi:MAG: hypothetical protein ABIP39_03135 [Polyangiaceae bacterium]
MTRRFTATFLAGAFFLVANPALAQVKWDASANAGVMRRFLSSGVGDGGFGPYFSLQGHVALLPLLRVGAYVSHDIAPVNGPEPLRRITAAGLRVKLTPPWPRGKFRSWVFVGLGYAGAYGPSYHLHLVVPPNNTAEDLLAGGSGGSFFEVPLGVGMAYMVRKPWELTAELGTKLGFGFTGTLYNDRPAFTQGGLQTDLATLGHDSAALFLTIGVGLDL